MPKLHMGDRRNLDTREEERITFFYEESNEPDIADHFSSYFEYWMFSTVGYTALRIGENEWYGC